MGEQRLIDANALFKNGCIIVRGEDGEMVASQMIELLRRAPTVDAVPVIRCKDCKHRDRYYCYHPEQMYLAVDIDYYCARGERRES